MRIHRLNGKIVEMSQEEIDACNPPLILHGEADGTIVEIHEEELERSEPPLELSIRRDTEMWRARVIMKTTLYNEMTGKTLFQAVCDEIEALPDGLQKILAQEAVERGSIFSADSPLVALLSGPLNIQQDRILELITQANALPA